MIDYFKEAMEVKQDGLFLVVLGASGVGKSHFIGTYPGRTLLLYGAGESHGPASAIKSNSDILPLAWNRGKDAKGNIVDLNPNKILSRIKEALNPEALAAAGIKCVAIDSLTNLCLDLKNTDMFKQRCMSAKGQHNSFKETEALIELLSLVTNSLQNLSDIHGIDSICTLDLNILSVADNGLILESKPGLPTFGVGKAIIQQFPDILVLGRLGENSEPTFQNFASVNQKSKDFETQAIVKYVEYHPRLRGAITLPETIPANVQSILDLKEADIVTIGVANA